MLVQCTQNGYTLAHSTPDIFQYMSIDALLRWSMCKVNILSICWNPNNSYLLSLECETIFFANCCIISWTELFCLL
jgi:hypothetical protein